MGYFWGTLKINILKQWDCLGLWVPEFWQPTEREGLGVASYSVFGRLMVTSSPNFSNVFSRIYLEPQYKDILCLGQRLNLQTSAGDGGSGGFLVDVAWERDPASQCSSYPWGPYHPSPFLLLSQYFLKYKLHQFFVCDTANFNFGLLGYAKLVIPVWIRKKCSPQGNACLTWWEQRARFYLPLASIPASDIYRGHGHHGPICCLSHPCEFLFFYKIFLQ